MNDVTIAWQVAIPVRTNTSVGSTWLSRELALAAVVHCGTLFVYPNAKEICLIHLRFWHLLQTEYYGLG